ETPHRPCRLREDARLGREQRPIEQKVHGRENLRRDVTSYDNLTRRIVDHVAKASPGRYVQDRLVGRRVQNALPAVASQPPNERQRAKKKDLPGSHLPNGLEDRLRGRY